MRNIYDEEVFFEEYAKMTRSRAGLAGAGEWHQFQRLFPELSGKTVLDLGCGYGWHCQYAAEHGAVRVVGIDRSEKMIRTAREKNAGDVISYQVCDLEEYEYPDGAFDCVVSNLVLHYVADLEAIYQKVFRTLKPDGVFLMNIEHPVFTAGVGQDWMYGENGEIKCWPVDDYFYPGERRTGFLGCEVIKQHHTLTQVLMGLVRAGFWLEAVEEAMPDPEMMGQPGMAAEMRRPMMLLVKARK